MMVQLSALLLAGSWPPPAALLALGAVAAGRGTGGVGGGCAPPPPLPAALPTLHAAAAAAGGFPAAAAPPPQRCSCRSPPSPPSPRWSTTPASTKARFLVVLCKASAGGASAACMPAGPAHASPWSAVPGGPAADGWGRMDHPAPPCPVQDEGEPPLPVTLLADTSALVHAFLFPHPGSHPPPPAPTHPCTVPRPTAGYSAKYLRQQHYGVMPGHHTVELAGAPDWQACQRLVAATANASAPCAGEHCVLGVPHPPLEVSAVHVRLLRRERLAVAGGGRGPGTQPAGCTTA